MHRRRTNRFFITIMAILMAAIVIVIVLIALVLRRDGLSENQKTGTAVAPYNKTIEVQYQQTLTAIATAESATVNARATSDAQSTRVAPQSQQTQPLVDTSTVAWATTPTFTAVMDLGILPMPTPSTNMQILPTPQPRLELGKTYIPADESEMGIPYPPADKTSTQVSPTYAPLSTANPKETPILAFETFVEAQAAEMAEAAEEAAIRPQVSSIQPPPLSGENPRETSTLAFDTFVEAPAAEPVGMIPITVRNVHGAIIGDGTIRLYAPGEAKYSDTVRIELALHLDHRYMTPTPSGPKTAPPVTPRISTLMPGCLTATPRTQRVEASGYLIYERMGASLLCLTDTFIGCTNPSDTSHYTDTNLRIIKDDNTWVWHIRALGNTVGSQDLQIELWSLQYVDDKPIPLIEWNYPFTIEVSFSDVLPGALASTTWGPNSKRIADKREDNGNSLTLFVIGTISTIVVLMGSAGFVWRQRRRPRPSIFISYQRSTGWTMARTLRDRLAALGADVFIDVESLHEGRFGERIQNAILRAEHFVVVLAPGTLNSEWVRKEAALAIAHEKNIVPVLIEGFDLYADLPDDVKGLANFNAIRFDPEYFDAALDKLADFVGLKPKK